MSLLLAAALALPPFAAPAAAQDSPSDHWDARITAVTGEPVVRPADGSGEAVAQAGMPLEEGDRIVTPAGSTAELALDGGSLIALSENSDFTLEKTARNNSVFSLALGSLLAKIQKLGSRGLSVRTATSVAAVRGTEFGVDAVEGESRVGVFDEGRVEVTSPGGAIQVLAPNQETSVAAGRPPLKAGPLRRFAARRERMRAHRLRLQAVGASWKALAPDERRAARRKVLSRLRAVREQRAERRAERRERRRAPRAK
jgi:hypothetical protein